MQMVCMYIIELHTSKHKKSKVYSVILGIIEALLKGINTGHTWCRQRVGYYIMYEKLFFADLSPQIC